MLNCPTDKAHRLTVMKLLSNKRYIQIVQVNAFTVEEFKRYSNGSAWGEWYRVVTEDQIPVIDNTLTIKNAAADAEAVGAEFNNYLTLNKNKCTLIPDNTDYNTYITPGNYYVPSVNNARTMQNCPVTDAAHRLFILNIITGRIIQIIIPSNVNIPLYIRYYNDDTEIWTAWLNFAYKNDIPVIDNTLTTENAAADAKATGDEIIAVKDITMSERIVSIGVGGVMNFYINSNGSWIKTTSTQKTGWWTRTDRRYKAVRITAGEYDTVISFLKTYSSSTVEHQGRPDFSSHYTQPFLLKAQNKKEFELFDDTKFIFITIKNSSGQNTTPSKIAFIGVNEILPDTGVMARAIQGSINNMFRECEAVYSTLPVQNGNAFVSEYYNMGDKINGILYSSVYRDGLDVYWNKNLETYYSAMANPASVLYTQDYTPKGIPNAHAMMGGVCSSFVSYILNFEHYNRTGQLASKLHAKSMNSIYEIEAGDILLKDGHIQMVSQLYMDNKGMPTAVEITEQVEPIARTFQVPFEDFEVYLETYGYTVMENTFGKPRYLKYDGFSEDIIFEYGNNTYVNVSETSEMWFYIPSNPEFVYYKKNNAETFSSLELSNVPMKIVNDVIVYDLSDCFSGVGDYVLTTNESNKKTCFIKIINTGTITIQNNQLTLSGFENCIPKHYQMVQLNSGPRDSTAGNPPEGYYCSWLDYYEIDGDYPQIIQDIPQSGKYKLAVEYETGVGLKRVFSTNIGV